MKRLTGVNGGIPPARGTIIPTALAIKKLFAAVPAHLMNEKEGRYGGQPRFIDALPLLAEQNDYEILIPESISIGLAGVTADGTDLHDYFPPKREIVQDLVDDSPDHVKQKREALRRARKEFFLKIAKHQFGRHIRIVPTQDDDNSTCGIAVKEVKSGIKIFDDSKNIAKNLAAKILGSKKISAACKILYQNLAAGESEITLAGQIKHRDAPIIILSNDPHVSMAIDRALTDRDQNRVRVNIEGFLEGLRVNHLLEMLSFWPNVLLSEIEKALLDHTISLQSDRDPVRHTSLPEIHHPIDTSYLPASFEKIQNIFSESLHGLKDKMEQSAGQSSPSEDFVSSEAQKKFDELQTSARDKRFERARWTPPTKSNGHVNGVKNGTLDPSKRSV